MSRIATANGTATAGSDYTAKSGTLTFAAGVMTQTITISIGTDRTVEPNETFFVNLSSPTGGAMIADGQAIVTIINDDGTPLLASAAPAADAPTATAITWTDLGQVISTAQAQWLAARPTADFTSVSFSIADLGGSLLGVTAGMYVTVDATAAGWGWTVLGGKMDLLTVVLHELGHVLGLDDDAAAGVMGASLAPGSVYRLGVLQSLPALSSRIQANASTLTTIAGVRLGLAWIFAPRTAVRQVVTRPVPPWALRLAPRVSPGHSNRKPTFRLLA